MPNEKMTPEQFRAQPKPHKYGARACVVNGIRFPSRREANRYSELRLLERAGKIAHLETQVRLPLEVNGMLISHYVADFKYFDTDARLIVHEDAKGFPTDIYRLKKKLVKALYGIDIVET
jgi:hypothetical protein